jgi:hypothetical protein
MSNDAIMRGLFGGLRDEAPGGKVTNMIPVSRETPIIEAARPASAPNVPGYKLGASDAKNQRAVVAHFMPGHGG